MQQWEYMQQWEFTTVLVELKDNGSNRDDLVREMNQMGDQGWEPFYMSTLTDNNEDVETRKWFQEIWLKRPKSITMVEKPQTEKEEG